MDKFEKGEVAIFWPCGSTSCPEEKGNEITIIEMPRQHYGNGAHSKGLAYGIEFQDGGAGWAIESHLRKKKPPSMSKDIEETRKRPANTWEEIKQDCIRELKEVETV